MEVITNYAYLYEDVFLLHALADIDSKSIFYVDVGANDPVDESVTCLFYTRGGSWNKY